MILFHLVHVRLAPGSVILPGNYGRLIRRIGWQHSNALREAVLENVRAAAFPDRPSRLSCVFCLPSEDSARVFQAENDGFPHHVLHRVRVVAGLGSGRVPVHRTDWRWVNPAATAGEVPGTVWAERYWRGLHEPPAHGLELEDARGAVAPVATEEREMRADERCEVLVGGPVAVEECLDLG